MKIFIIPMICSLSIFSCAANDSDAGTASQASITTVSQDGSTQLEKDMVTIEAHLKEQGISNFKKTENGLYYTVNQQGEGAEVKSGMQVSVHYTGTLLDGKKFDSSRDRGQPFSFVIGQGRVIKGWDQGIPLFNVGGSGTLYIPSELAYGSQEITGVIPANSCLKFEIEVVDAVDPVAQAKAAREANEKAIADYLAANNLTTQKTESGLHYIIEEQGTGEQAAAGRNVSVHYAGTLLDGSEFDNSFKRGEPISFPLGTGRVIKGWDEGIALFKVGGKGKLIIPADLAYGGRARPGIPANSVLVFEIELVSVD
jgi:peptidylprolyl isomerase